MPSSDSWSPPPDPTSQPAYVWSRIDPRRNRLIRSKLRRANLELRKEIDTETQRIRVENRLNSNKWGVDQQVVRMWAGKIKAHAETCYDTVFCHHWGLLGHAKTGAFVRACSTILGRQIEQLGNTAAHEARSVYRRRGGVGQSLEEAYKKSAGSVRKQLEESWNIEAGELDLAASVTSLRKHSGTPPPQPVRGPGEPSFYAKSDNYQTIVFLGREYNLTPQAGAIVKVLHEAGERPVAKADIQSRTKCGKISDSFRRLDGPEVWKNLIDVTKGRKGFYSLRPQAFRHSQ